MPERPDERTERYDEVARLAYEYWEAEGAPGDRAIEHWLRAEAEVEHRRAHHRQAVEEGTVPMFE